MNLAFDIIGMIVSLVMLLFGCAGIVFGIKDKRKEPFIAGSVIALFALSAIYIVSVHISEILNHKP